MLPGATPTSIRELLRRCLDKDPTRRLQNIVDARKTIERAQRGRNQWRIAAIATAALAVVVIGGTVWFRGPAPVPSRSEWIQLTRLPDSVSQPALSPDGRMVTFIRGPATFLGPGQVYVKTLPDGEPVQLTHDNHRKTRPVFSPDGTRIAYTVVGAKFLWDTWVVPVLGGEPRQWLKNASGLVWTGPQEVMFAKIKQSPHMGIVAANGCGKRMSTCPRMNTGWRTWRTGHPTENGCSSSKWTRITPGCHAACFRWVARRLRAE
jgi:hypothetical protein